MVDSAPPFCDNQKSELKFLLNLTFPIELAQACCINFKYQKCVNKLCLSPKGGGSRGRGGGVWNYSIKKGTH